MKNEDPELDQLLSPLRDGPVSLGSAEADAARREQLLPKLRGLVRAAPLDRARRRKLRTLREVTFVSLALASSFVLGLQVRDQPADAPPSSPARSASAPVASAPVREPSAESGITTPTTSSHAEPAEPEEIFARHDRGRSWRSVGGAQLELEPRARLRVVPSEPDSPIEAVALMTGAVSFSVPKLAGGRTFVVTTPTARVIVHGTEFRVGLDARLRSCVSVREGLVEVQVRGESKWLRAGDAWGCEPERRPAPDRAARRHKPRAPEAAQPRQREGVALDETLARGTLSAETNLLAAALRAEQQGQRERAAVLFARFLARYPHSPLATDARAGALRVR